MQGYPSIFNDAIGPVMRGPSSSHCAAALRIGRLARDLMEGHLDQVLVEFDPTGSLATTHATQGSDMGLCGGLLGWEATDERLVSSVRTITAAGIEVVFQVTEIGAPHPNTYKLTLTNGDESHTMTAISTGGGMIEVTAIDGAPVSIRGDTYETLLTVRGDAAPVAQALGAWTEADAILDHAGAWPAFVEVKAQRFLPEEFIARAREAFDISRIRTLAPVLPVLSRRDLHVPFLTCDEMMTYNEDKGLALWELACHYEGARGNLTCGQVLTKMRETVRIMQTAVEQGIAGTDYADRILGQQSDGFQRAMVGGQLLDGGILNRMILYVTALMEVKSAMGVFVAAPTAGACGGLPGACLGAVDAMGLGVEEAAKAMLAAGLIGVFIAARATFAAEVAGCQAECGAGSAMAAAALVTLAQGTAEQAVSAASMALQNVLGLICDPVANRVEVPCLGRNVMAASNALACANMALAGYDAVVPLDEVIETMLRVGESLPSALRCTALGGLSITRTSREIEARLDLGDQAR
ncbi:MAG: L-serine ammonia-lyase, iron-sulfur-dependent, subunit alpha [Anaerolineae bacterium]|nr:L-serine ammonia-lyase, iron-sulfur-dependent, subunit alpha [Anaerolineae bacterium]